MLEITNWTSDTWTAIAAVVAFVALVQPWIIAAWGRFFRRGTVDIYETGTIEIGFSAFGPTVGLMGTLRSRDRDMFVQSATVTILKKGTAIIRRFEWVLFRNPKTVIGSTVGQSAEVAVDAPSSFLILTTQPYRYNVAFYDVAIGQPARSILEGFKQSFQTYVDKKTDLDVYAQPLDTNSRNRFIQQLRRAHNKFADTNEYGTAFSSFEELFYWEAGPYQLTLQVHTARPNRTFIKTWSFSLLGADIDNLRNNVPSVFEEIVGVPLTAGTYLFAYPFYIYNSTD